MLEDNRTISFKFWRKMISNVESFSAKLLAEITNTCSHSSKCGIKESACNAGAAEDPGLIPESGRSPGGGLGNSLQYSCLENPMDWGAWRATVHGVTKSRTRLSDWAHKLVKILHFHCRGTGLVPSLGTKIRLGVAKKKSQGWEKGTKYKYIYLF